jgi:hypothetical protein
VVGGVIGGVNGILGFHPASYPVVEGPPPVRHPYFRHRHAYRRRMHHYARRHAAG